MFNIFIDKIYENRYKKFQKSMEQKQNIVFLGNSARSETENVKLKL